MLLTRRVSQQERGGPCKSHSALITDALQGARADRAALDMQAFRPGGSHPGTKLSSWEATWFGGEERFWTQVTPLLLNSWVTLGNVLFLDFLMWKMRIKWG